MTSVSYSDADFKISGQLLEAILKSSDRVRESERLFCGTFYLPERLLSFCVDLPAGSFELRKFEVHSFPAVAQLSRDRRSATVFMLISNELVRLPADVVMEALTLGAIRQMPSVDTDGVLRSPRRTWHLSKMGRS